MSRCATLLKSSHQQQHDANGLECHRISTSSQADLISKTCLAYNYLRCMICGVSDVAITQPFIFYDQSDPTSLSFRRFQNVALNALEARISYPCQPSWFELLLEVIMGVGSFKLLVRIMLCTTNAGTESSTTFSLFISIFKRTSQIISLCVGSRCILWVCRSWAKRSQS